MNNYFGKKNENFRKKHLFIILHEQYLHTEETLRINSKFYLLVITNLRY